ncbi:nitroreductase family protein [Propionibacterium australiense]|nr:nitroreductase family protein [Propionibacterium australiense]RLP08552.1 nitroreductase [Propionibacterium australiense]
MNEMTPLLTERWSPRGFDPTHVVSAEQIDRMLEAARWAPSAMNRQPWAFVVGRRGEPVYERLEKLATGASDWALGASALLLTAYRSAGNDPDYALYDLGGAVAHMSVQAEAMGLHVRQFASYDHEGARTEFGIGQDWTPVTMLAVGIAASGLSPAGRERKDISELTPWQ